MLTPNIVCTIIENSLQYFLYHLKYQVQLPGYYSIFTNHINHCKYDFDNSSQIICNCCNYMRKQWHIGKFVASDLDSQFRDICDLLNNAPSTQNIDTLKSVGLKFMSCMYRLVVCGLRVNPTDITSWGESIKIANICMALYRL